MDTKVEVLCKVCGDKASGKHYGVPSCDGCRGFFKRSIRRGLAYHCKESGTCVVDVTRRNQCQSCRFKKCLQVNMKRDAVQHERAPRSSIQSAPCSNMATTRRHSYGFPPPSFLTPSGPVVDVPAYHFIYQPPAFPFHYGVKPVTSMTTAGLGIFNCHNAHLMSTAPRGTETFDWTHYIQPSSSNSKVEHRTSRNETEDRRVSRPTVFKEEEDEVTSSEEARTSEGIKHKAEFRQPLLDLPPSHGPDNIYESSAKLLFLTVKWARSIPSFVQLSATDQCTLLEECWSDLFVLSAAQWALPIDEEYLVSRTLSSSSRQEVLRQEAIRLKEVVARFLLLRIDHTEYACLKALALFKSETRGLSNGLQIEILQDQTHVMLHDYCAAQDAHKTRFGKLLLLLPSVNNLSKHSIEELLFRKTIGNISIERILTDMLKHDVEQTTCE